MWPRRRHSRCRKIPERTSNISSRKCKARLGGLRDNLLLDRVPIEYRHIGDLPLIAVGVGVGSAGGIVTVVGAPGDGDSFLGPIRASNAEGAYCWLWSSTASRSSRRWP
jgi:hypothetical protein